ncbi:MAG: hypothetical protein PHF60_01645 [Candidatus ainarchaeum sp.]|nr:hypothetical protein [Candidatus ainarchaeum sp.]
MKMSLRLTHAETPKNCNGSTDKGVSAWLPPPWMIPLIDKEKKSPSKGIPEHPEERPELEIDDSRSPVLPDSSDSESPRGVVILDLWNVIPEGRPRQRPKNNP